MDSSKRVWIWGGLALATGLGFVMAKAHEETFGEGKQRVLLIGDELAEGLATPLGTLAEAAGMVFFVDGKKATTVTDWTTEDWLLEDLARFRPTVVIVCLGMADMLLAAPEAEAPEVVSLLHLAASGGASVIWVPPPLLPFDAPTVRQMIASATLPFPSEALAIPRGPDDIFPTARGYAGWAGEIWRWLGEPLSVVD
jgi:hypothetical protein